MPMSKLEIIAVCIAAAIPVIVLLWFIPKRKAKVKKAKEETKPVQQEVKFESSKEDPKPFKKDGVRVFENKNLSAKDLEDVLRSKAATTSKPTKNPERPDFSMPFPDFMSYQEAKARAKNSKPIAEQIKELSPELKTMLITGALNKKEY